RDKDPYEYAKAERVIPASKDVAVEFSITPAQADKGLLHIECVDEKGNAAARLIFDADSMIKAKAGYRNSGVLKYEAGKQYDFRVELHTASRSYNVFINGEKRGTRIFFAPV